MSDYYYYKENGNLYRFRIERDEMPWDPRKDQDGNIGTMNLYWNRYMLGDNEGKGDADDALDEIIFENVPEEVLIKKALNGDFDTPQYEFYKKGEGLMPEEYDHYLALTPNGNTYVVPADEFVDEILSEMKRNEKMVLLQSYIVLLPCYIYEHSGLSISCSNASYPFNDRWDAGCAGYIYTTKEKCFEEWGAKEMSDFEWKARATKELVDEVKLYDKYLQGECYGFCQEKYEPQDDEWIDDESCWGYYSDKWGDELVREIANDGITGEPFISEEEAEAEMEELRVMAQADTMVCM